MPGKRKRLSNASPMPASYTTVGSYDIPITQDLSNYVIPQPNDPTKYITTDDKIKTANADLIRNAAIIQENALIRQEQQINKLRNDLLQRTNDTYPVSDIRNQALMNNDFLLQSSINRAQRPFGGGIPEGVPFIESPITYNPNGIDISTNSIVRSRRVPLHKVTIENTPISQTVRNRQYIPVDEDVINSWRANRNRMPFNDINNNRIRPYSGARRANNKSNYKYSRNEQSWLNPKNSKVAEQYNRNIRAAKYLKGAGASLPFVALALNQTPDMLYYNDEGYQIDPETNQILDTPVNRRLYTQREHQRRVNKAANPKLEQAANRFINLNPKNTTNKSSNKNTETNNQSNNTPIQQYNWGQGRKPFYDSSNRLTSNSFVKPVNSTSQTKNKTTNKQSTPTNTTHTVKSGDSPWQIAKDNGISLNTFYKLNPNARNGIYPGDVVNVNKFANIHKVKSGDSPWQIAKDNNISLDELYKLNPEARNMIYPGDELILPDKTRNKKRYGGSLRRRLESGGYLSY